MGKQHHSAGNAPLIRVWELDPADGATVELAAPHPKADLFGLRLPKPHPPAGVYEPGTAAFRFWVAAEALHRAAQYWTKIARVEHWQIGKHLPVILDEGVLLNAYYNRTSISFFHAPGPAGTVWSGESPDVVCHEVGHAVLDAIRPDLFHAALQEVSAFHEAFADIAAMCSALQLTSVRQALLADTGGDLYRDSRLSRLAVQLGAALRATIPDAVDGRCLRNAVNSFCYADPEKLPVRSPATMLSSEPHSFSRIFTAAALEIMAALLKIRMGLRAVSEQDLVGACDDLATILVEGVRVSAVVANWYAQVAANMIVRSGRLDPRYPAALRQVFVQRGILSLRSAAAVRHHGDAEEETPIGNLAMIEYLLPAGHLGLTADVAAEAVSAGGRRLVVAPAGSAEQAASSGNAAQTFVDDLARRGRLAIPENDGDQLFAGKSHVSHALVADSGTYRLRRVLFDCGWCG